ncbi:MAG: bifunctional 5,10-methylenetetrahydrofolate dehydrogenase/5,10-methenyltetrahydrofolate cyclohydrolase [bacterium]
MTQPLIIDGKAIARQVRAEVKARVARLGARGITPGLRILHVGEDPASDVYVGSKEKASAQAGIACSTRRLPATAGLADCIAAVEEWNHDPAVHGVIVQLPLPKGIDPHAVLDRLDPRKDADGLTTWSAGALVSGRAGFKPATPLGIIELLVRSSIPITGRRVVVVGRSELVGRPLANLLMLRGERADATVTVCHTRTADLGAVTRTAEILVLATGKAGLVTGEMVSEGVVVIDAGITRLDTPEGCRLVGDADFASVAPRASAITPVPGGVGPMTVAMLLCNTVTAAENVGGKP